MTDTPKQHLSRRRFLQSTATGAVAALAAPYLIRPAQAAEDEVILLTWETYSEDPWLEEFSKANNVKVTAVRSGSVDEMFAKLSSGAVMPDMLYIDTSVIPRLRGMDLLAAIDPSRVPNLANVSPAIDYQKASVIDGSLYALPYNWGPIPMMYRPDMVPSGSDSWHTMWDPRYTGRVAMADDSFMSVVVVALVAAAENPYALTEEEFAKVTELLKTLRPQVKAMTVGNNDAQALFSAGEVDIGMCMNPPIVANLKKEGKNVEFSIPVEGVPSWLDCAMMTKKGDRDIVYKFLDAQLSIEWQKRFIEFATSPGVLDVKTAKAAGVADAVIDQTVMALLDKPDFWASLNLFQTVEDTDRRLQLWNDFKAGIL
jgi:spermidine/putrescine transport system substrate-binding protein